MRRPKNGDMAGTFGISRPSPAHNGGQVWVSSAWPSCMRSTVGVLCASQRGPLSYSMILLRKPHYQRIKGPPPSPGEFAGSFGVCVHALYSMSLGEGLKCLPLPLFGTVGCIFAWWRWCTRKDLWERPKIAGNMRRDSIL